MTRHNFARLKPYRDVDGGAGGGAGASENPPTQTNGGQDPASNSVSIDYDKIAQIVEGKQRASEESVLKGYFKEQGLSADEMKEAIKSFKEQQAKNTPNVDEITKQRDEALEKALKSEITATAYTMADEFGLTAKEMPYVIKMADLTSVVENGEISTDKLKESIDKVLTDIPQLRPSKDTSTGFKGKIGSDGGNGGSDKEAMLRKAMGLA